MKKALILTTSTGQGHNKAAEALIEELKEYDYECVKYDFLANTDRIINGIVINGYNIMATKAPRLYGYGYKCADNRYTNKILHLGFYRVYEKIYKYVKENNFDIIIATHPLAVNVIEKLKKKNISIPAISIVTDFKAHYAYISKEIDEYIAASSYTKETLVDRGIDKNKVKALGIPINKKFYVKNDESKSQDEEYFNILLMGGSMGMKGISYVLSQLLNNKNKLSITVVCGKNKRLRKSLLKYGNRKNDNIKVRILGFTNEIDKLMDQCDLLISKPGGITVTESIVKKVPLIIPFAIPGQETENVSFLTSHHLAYYVKDYKEIDDVIDRIIMNPNVIEEIKENMEKMASNYSTKEIAYLCNELIKGNKVEKLNKENYSQQIG